MPTVEELIVKIQADIKSLELGLTKAKAELKKLEHATAQASAKSSANMKQISASLTSLASAARIAYATIASYAAYAASMQIVQYSKMAARAEVLEESFRRLAKKHGFDADKILANLDKLAKGTIQRYDLILAANRALLLGIPIDKLDELMKIAIVRARAMGLSYAQAFNDIVTGIGRASPMILDNLGIIAKAEEAYREYAKMIGKSADELTSQQQKLALLEYVINHNTEILKEYNEIQLEVTKAEKWEQVGAAIADVKYELGELVGPEIIKGLNLLKDAIEGFKLLRERTHKIGIMAYIEPTIVAYGEAQRKYREFLEKMLKISLPKSPIEIYAEAIERDIAKAREIVQQISSIDFYPDKAFRDLKRLTSRLFESEVLQKKLTDEQLASLRELYASYVTIRNEIAESDNITAEQLEKLDEAKKKLDEYIEKLAEEVGIRKEILRLFLQQIDIAEKQQKEEKINLDILRKAVKIHNQLLELKAQGKKLTVEQQAQLEWANDVILAARHYYGDLVAKKMEGKQLVDSEVVATDKLRAILSNVVSEAYQIGDAFSFSSMKVDEIREKARQLAEEAHRYLQSIGAEEVPKKEVFIPHTLESAIERYGVELGTALYREFWGIGTQATTTAVAKISDDIQFAKQKVEEVVSDLERRLEAINTFSFSGFAVNFETGVLSKLDASISKLNTIINKLNSLDGKRVNVHLDISSSLANRGLL